MKPTQTQHQPCLQKNAPRSPSPPRPPPSSPSSSSPIAPAFSIPRLNSEQIAIICRYILSVSLLLRNLLLLFLRSSRRASSLIYSPSQNSCQILCPPRSARSPRSSIRRTTTEMTVGRASSIFDEGRGRPTGREREREGGRHRKNLLMLQLL